MCHQTSFFPWVALTLFFAHSVAWAQFDLFKAPNRELEKQQTPENTFRDLREEEEQRRLEETQRGVPSRSSRRVSKKTQPKISTPRFLVKRIIVNRSGTNKKKDISKILKKYEGQYLNVIELQQIIGELNNLYKDKKGGLSRAVLPPQKIKDGVVKIIIVESKIGKVIFQDTRYTSLKYLKWALPIEENEDTNLGELEKVFIRFNRTHNGIFVTSSLKSGGEFSETDIIVSTNESKRWGLGVSMDNEGSQSTGSMRYGITGQNNSLLGIDDPLTIGVNRTDGQTSTFLSYEFPFTSFGSRFKGLYSLSKQNIVDGSFSDLSIEGETTFLSGRVSHPIFVNKLWKITWANDLSYSISQNMLSIFELETITQKYNSKIEVNKRDSKGAWLVDLAFSRAMTKSSLNGTTTTDEAYQKWVGKFSRYQSLGRSISLVGKLSGQYTSDNFISTTERFSLGGNNNLSYESSEFLGDVGYVAELELQYSAGWERYMPSVLQPATLKFFSSFQMGSTTLYQQDGSLFSKEDGVSSLALGLRSQITRRFNLDFILAAPLNHDRYPTHDARYLLFKFKTIL